jgi:hypothetical protein
MVSVDRPDEALVTGFENEQKRLSQRVAFRRG